MFKRTRYQFVSWAHAEPAAWWQRVKTTSPTHASGLNLPFYERLRSLVEAELRSIH